MIGFSHCFFEDRLKRQLAEKKGFSAVDVEKSQGFGPIRVLFSGFILSLQALQASFFLQAVSKEAKFFKKGVDFYTFLTNIRVILCINKH